jgi:hypothetical protein
MTKRVHSTHSASDIIYQLLTHGPWYSRGTPASSTTKTGRDDIAEILLKVALSTINQIKLNPFKPFGFLSLLLLIDFTLQSIVY